MYPHYKYIGPFELLKNHTTIGRVIDGKFKVQVDEFSHPMSHFWHTTNPDHWVEI